MKDKAIVLLASLIVLLATSCGQVQEKIEFEKIAVVNKYQDYTQKNISAKLIDFNGIMVEKASLFLCFIKDKELLYDYLCLSKGRKL